MSKKYNTKKKFVTRGMYAIRSGTYENSFIINIKEFNHKLTGEKAILIFPPKQSQVDAKNKGIAINPFTTTMSKYQMLRSFTEGHLQHVETIPKKVYKEFIGIYKKLQETQDDTSD